MLLDFTSAQVLVDPDGASRAVPPRDINHGGIGLGPGRLGRIMQHRVAY